MADPQWRCPPCQDMSSGRLCGRTDERPTVLDPLLGIICLDHRPSLATKPKAEA